MNDISNILATAEPLDACNAALELADKGYRVLPVKEGAKKPVIRDWQNKASNEQSGIASMFAHSRKLNLGILTDDLLVVDIDKREDGDGYQHLDELKLAAGKTWDEAPVIVTPSGGSHHYFRLTKGLRSKYDLKSGANIFGKGSRVDIKTGAAYVIAPPSQTSTGSYRGELPPKDELPVAPEGLLELITAKRTRSSLSSDTGNGPLGHNAAEPEFFQKLNKRGKSLWKMLEACKSWNILDVQANADWETVMLALAAEVDDGNLSGNEAWDILDGWSKTLPNGSDCPNYNYEENHRRFNNVHRKGGGRKERVTFGSIHHKINTWLESCAPKGEAVDLLLVFFGDAPVPKGLAHAAINRDWCIIRNHRNELRYWSERDEAALGHTAFKTLLKPLQIETRGKPMPAAESWVGSSDRRMADGISFAPGKPLFFEGKDGKSYVNSFRGLNIEDCPRPDDQEEVLRPILEHLVGRMCQGNKELADEVIKLLAWWVQNPDKPGQKALVLRGGQGTGKTVFGKLLMRIFAPYATETGDSGKVAGRFNGFLDEKLFLLADEAFFAGNHEQRRLLKALITDDMVTYERKGQDAYQGRNYLRIVMTTNEEWAVPAELDDRRYVVLDVKERQEGDEDYFSSLHRAVSDDVTAAVFHDYLAAFQLDGWHPARMQCLTKALLEQKLQSLGAPERFVFESLMEGRFLDVEIPHCPAADINSCMGSGSEPSQLVLEPHQSDRIVEAINRDLGLHEKMGKSTITKKLKKCFGMDSKKSGSARRWVIPCLEEGRRAFERYVGSPIDWS